MKWLKALDRWFTRFSRSCAYWTGRPQTFIASCAAIALWILSGPIFDWSDSWQLIVNTATTVLTFLMVFVIQNTMNHDTTTLHLKLDELIRADVLAHNELIDMDVMEEEELAELKAMFERLAKDAHEAMLAKREKENAGKT